MTPSCLTVCLVSQTSDILPGVLSVEVLGRAHPEVLGRAHPEVLGRAHIEVLGRAHTEVLGRAHTEVGVCVDTQV